jgi:hypothetical protein
VFRDQGQPALVRLFLRRDCHSFTRFPSPSRSCSILSPDITPAWPHELPTRDGSQRYRQKPPFARRDTCNLVCRNSMTLIHQFLHRNAVDRQTLPVQSTRRSWRRSYRRRSGSSVHTLTTVLREKYQLIPPLDEHHQSRGAGMVERSLFLDCDHLHARLQLRRLTDTAYSSGCNVTQ